MSGHILEDEKRSFNWFAPDSVVDCRVCGLINELVKGFLITDPPARSSGGQIRGCVGAVQGNRSSLGAHSRAVLTTARAAAPNATVRPMTASRTNRRAAEGWATAELAAALSRAACFCLRRRRRTESGRCWVDARSKSLKVEAAMLWRKREKESENESV